MASQVSRVILRRWASNDRLPVDDTGKEECAQCPLRFSMIQSSLGWYNYIQEMILRDSAELLLRCLWIEHYVSAKLYSEDCLEMAGP